MLHAMLLPFLIAAEPQCPNETAKATSVRGVKSSAIAYPESAMVLVQVGADGRMIDATVVQSSHDKLVDLALVQAAQRGTYAPAITDCQPVPGTVALFFTTLSAGSGITVDIPDHWCDRAQRVEAVIVNELEVPRAALEKAAANGRQLSSGVRVEIGADGKPVRTSPRVYESTGSDEVDGYAVAGALSRGFATGPSCKLADTEAFYIPSFIVAP